MNTVQQRRTQSIITVTVIGVLLCATAVVWWQVVEEVRRDIVTVSFLDVGQGDAVFIETKRGKQVLIDGGASRAVLRELGAHMSFFDRSIDVVVATHPDADHIGGLPDVFERYVVGMYLEPGVESESELLTELYESVSQEKLETVRVRNNMYLTLDEETTLQVLFPDRDVEAFDPNTGSLVLRLTYKGTSFLFTGDMPAGIEAYVVQLYGDALKSDVLKLGHHGSKTSSSELFLGVVDPRYAVVSAGCDNSYGHPHEEVLARLQQFGIPHVSTCKEGTITFTTDGQDVQLVP